VTEDRHHKGLGYSQEIRPCPSPTPVRSFSRDCRYMLALGMTLQPILWDLKEQREVWRLKNAETLQMAFHPDGRRFVTICNDKVAIHATSDGREIITLGHGWPPVTFSSDGRQLIYRQDNEHMVIVQSDDWTLPDKKAFLQAALHDVQQELHLKP